MRPFEDSIPVDRTEAHRIAAAIIKRERLWLVGVTCMGNGEMERNERIHTALVEAEDALREAWEAYPEQANVLSIYRDERGAVSEQREVPWPGGRDA